MDAIAENVYIEDRYMGVTLGIITQTRGLIQIDAPPSPEDGRAWRASLRAYVDYLKRAATTTAPYHVLPAYVYRAGDEVKEVPDSGALHGATRTAYRAQVLAGLPMGEEWYLRAFPVWFARRGNYGILLSQAKALAAAARLRARPVADRKTCRERPRRFHLRRRPRLAAQTSAALSSHAVSSSRRTCPGRTRRCHGSPI